MADERSEFVCPISMTVMEDPVILAETGISYERKEITAWFIQGKRTCPCTRVELTSQDLIPNRALKEAIDRWNREESRPGTPPMKQTGKKGRTLFPIKWLCGCFKFEDSESEQTERRQTNVRRPTREIANTMTEAVRTNDERILQELYKKGWSFDVLDDTGRAPIHTATINDNLTIVHLLGSFQVALDFQDRLGCTALHWAARLGHYSVVKSLVSMGVNVNAKNHLQMTPLHMAAFWGRGDIIRLMIRKGANLEALNNKLERPVDVARNSPWESAKQILPILDPTNRDNTASLSI